MADSYWRYAGDSRQPQPQSMPSLTGKRPRSDYDVPSGRDLSSYYSRDDDRGALRVIRDSDSIGASYDRYLHSGTISSYGGGQSARAISGVPARPVDDLRMVSMGSMDPGSSVKDRSMRTGSGRSEVSLPPDASSTLFVEGLPSDCTRREVSHIFRPFVGYKEVRLVSKESRHPGGDPLVLCFVDFLSPAHAATSMDALQGKTHMVQGIWSGQSGDGGSLLCSKPFLLGSIEASSWLPADQSGGYHQGQTSFAN
ncbi:RNA-binding protein 1-like isoform X1 [Populus alba x Populus x berolinensis]|nr:RNA-binding protein 1-like isoform X1 [Populus alba x Populus x berolinensis]